MGEKTKLTWDSYTKYLEMAILDSKFVKRAEIKPMTTPKADAESHITSRALHQRITAEIIKRITDELNYNGDYAYIGMLLHDAGHPFSAHEGEEIFNTIGRNYNTGFYHHNAKGVEVILSEDICDKAINLIPDIDKNPELRKQLEEEFYYFLDIVISHDGEALKNDLKKEATLYDSMREAVQKKLRDSNSKNNYKFIAQTEEGKLAKIADVLAYVPTDIQDGFRLGVITRFDDDYLRIIGSMLSDDENLTDEEKIKIAKEKIVQIRTARMRDNRKDMDEPENKEIMQQVLGILETAKEKGIDIFALSDEEKTSIDEILEERIKELEAKQKFKTEEEKQFFLSNMSKLREFTTKMISTGSNVVSDITSLIREYFVNDFINNSKKNGRASFSKKAEDLLYDIKKHNYNKICQYTKWDYQKNEQPNAALALVDKVAKNFIESGIIRDKFYDSSIRKYVSNEEALQYMKTPFRSEEKYIGNKIKIKGRKSNKAHGARGIKARAKSITGVLRNLSPKKLHTYELYRTANQYARKEGYGFAVKYMNVFDAIPYTVEKNVESALKNEIEQQDMLQNFQRNCNKKLVDRMVKEYGSIEEARLHKQEFINMLVEEEKGKMEEKMAIQLAIDYLSGMTDRSFNDIAIKTGHMKRRDVYYAKRKNKKCQSIERILKAMDNEEKALNNQGGTERD